MKTWQDLQAIGENEKTRMDFVHSVITEHKSTELYQTAKDADQYNRHRNVTINRFQKILYTVSGKAIPDNWSANFKMASRFFHRFITQKNQFLLGNGVTWQNEDTEEKLENKKYPFDNQLQDGGEKASWGGVSFGFWNLDHIEIFSVLEYAPLYDEENGSMKSGVRFWQIDDSKPLRATLYELDGYTEYMWYSDEKLRLGKEWRLVEKGCAIKDKRPYKLKIRSSEADGVEIYDGENYPTFPIVPFWGNKEHQSELVGLREQIDCYDLIKSGFANNVDEASLIYWTLTNAGGMDDIDLAQFVERLKTVKAVTITDDVDVQSHTLDVPYQSREALLQRLEKDLYKDAMALDTENIANGATTATQIRAAYEPLNSKVDSYEYCVLDFIQGILELAGIEDEPTFTRSMIVNVNESVQTILQASAVLPEDYVTEKVLTLLGDGDRAEELINQMSADETARFDDTEETEQTEETEPIGTE